jgi:hypothetical protein
MPKRFAFRTQPVRQAIRRKIHGESGGHELTVRSRINFNWQPLAFGIDHVFHEREYRPEIETWRHHCARFTKATSGRFTVFHGDQPSRFGVANPSLNQSNAVDSLKKRTGCPPQFRRQGNNC